MIAFLPFIIACANMPSGDHCGAWAGHEFYTDHEVCVVDLQDNMQTLLEDTHKMRGYVYWIKGECAEVTRRAAE